MSIENHDAPLPDWAEAIRAVTDPTGKRVIDLGCGSGRYLAAWAGFGAGHVTGVDISAATVQVAAETARDWPNVAVHQGAAAETGLPAGSADILFARGLIPCLDDRPACLQEAGRVLSPGGLVILQDRTPADVALPGSPEHIRGYFIEAFPRLAAIDGARRPPRGMLESELGDAGFTDITTLALWETRKIHADPDALATDLTGRTGRTGRTSRAGRAGRPILQDLSEDELARLVTDIVARLPPGVAVRERERWTIWTARKPEATGAAPG